jgi:hypothetical protein
LENNFGIFWCLVGAKIMLTKIIFGLTVKTFLIFGKRFTIFKTVNRFPKLSSLFLQACLISNRQNLAIVGRRDPVGSGVRQHPVAGILPTPESGHRQTKFRPGLDGSGY